MMNLFFLMTAVFLLAGLLLYKWVLESHNGYRANADHSVSRSAVKAVSISSSEHYKTASSVDTPVFFTIPEISAVPSGQLELFKISEARELGEHLQSRHVA